MDMILNRFISNDITNKLISARSKIIVIYGARQVGKTTLVNSILHHSFSDKKILKLEGDDSTYHDVLSSSNKRKLLDLVSGYDLLFIDEAQKIENIGINLKILYDNCGNKLKIIVTGSSALDLASKVREPLTGRHYTYYLYPISFLELGKNNTNFELNDRLEERLIFGSYPEVFTINNIQDKRSYLTSLSSDYLYKDVLEIDNIKFHKKIRDLIRLLAFQIGSEVSYNEIATSLQMDRKTVDSYIDLLEKAFIIQRCYSFSRNLRKEVIKKPKIYFYDLGIRNAIIENFNYLDVRNDKGALWENFLFIERTKRNHYLKHLCNTYFWRTYTGAELDYVEEYDGELHGYEFKWNKKGKAPQSWIETYKEEKASFKCINRDNFLEFIL